MRVAGHTLANEGAPFMRLSDGRPFRINGVGTGGKGAGLCSCGEMSDELPSGQARKDWHRHHKQSPILRHLPAVPVVPPTDPNQPEEPRP